MGVDVVIVNWNGGPELIRAVKSVQRFGGRPIMVGNASTEGSINDLTAAARVTLLRHGTNRGFSVACNTGVAAGDASVVMLLNPDAEIVAGTADQLEAAFDTTGADLLGVRLLDEHGSPVESARALPTTSDLLADLLRTRPLRNHLGMRLERRTSTDEPFSRDDRPRPGWVHGAAVAIRRASWMR